MRDRAAILLKTITMRPRGLAEGTQSVTMFTMSTGHDQTKFHGRVITVNVETGPAAERRRRALRDRASSRRRSHRGPGCRAAGLPAAPVSTRRRWLGLGAARGPARTGRTARRNRATRTGRGSRLRGGPMGRPGAHPELTRGFRRNHPSVSRPRSQARCHRAERHEVMEVHWIAFPDAVRRALSGRDPGRQDHHRPAARPGPSWMA